MEDGVQWKQSGNVCFPIKDIVAKINESYTPTLPKPVVNIVWKLFIPPRAKLSVWLANLERFKTGDLPVDKGIIDSQEVACPFCNIDMESNSHILFTCRFAWSTWMKILEWWGISTALHNRCSNFTIEWLGLVKSRNCQKLWGLILGCVIWLLWCKRNKIKFESRAPHIHNFVYSLKIRI